VLRGIIHRLATVIYWAGLVLSAMVGMGAVIAPVVMISDDKPISEAIGTFALLTVLSFAVHGTGWAVRYILTGEKEWLPWGDSNR